MERAGPQTIIFYMFGAVFVLVIYVTIMIGLEFKSKW